LFAAIVALAILHGQIAWAQFQYRTGDNQIIITGYTGNEPAVTIPATIDGLPVTQIDNAAFLSNGAWSMFPYRRA
jgi:hypothetical protein